MQAVTRSFAIASQAEASDCVDPQQVRERIPVLWLMRPKRETWLYVLIASVLSIGLTTVGFAIAAPAPSPVVRSCVNKSTGAVRIPATTAPCKATERALSWNQTGPPGPSGPAGALSCADEMRFAYGAPNMEIRKACAPEFMDSKGQAGAGLGAFPQADGSSLVLYQIGADAGGAKARIVRCTNATCATSPTDAALTFDAGRGATIGPRGLPAADPEIRYEFCTTAPCTAVTRLPLDPQGVPLFVEGSSPPSFFSRDLKRIDTCGDETCAAITSRTVTGPRLSDPRYITRLSDGSTLFAGEFNFNEGRRLQFLSCNATCDIIDTRATGSIVSTVPVFLRMTDGNVAAAYGKPGGGVFLATCIDALCSDVTETQVDATNLRSEFRSIRVSALDDGVLIGYLRADGIGTATCTAIGCAMAEVVGSASSTNRDFAVGVAGGQPFVFWQDAVFTAVRHKAITL